MADKSLFTSLRGTLSPKANARNNETSPAYKFGAEHMLAQYAATGCLSNTFYASAQDQLETILKLCKTIDPVFIAQTAVYCREKGAMKDMPALLCAILSVKDPALLEKIFDRVIDNGRMLRNFVQIMRSGVVGRKSLGSLPKRLIRRWLDARDDTVFRASVGNAPSMADIVKMVHPKPASKSREALYAYMLKRETESDALPDLVRQYEAFKRDATVVVPKVPFQMLTSLDMSTRTWTQIAENAGWHMTRMNLNSFARHGVFQNRKITRRIAARLRDADEIRKARAFPYQLMAAYTMTGRDIPHEVREALQDAMEIATENVPRIDGKVYVFPDVSGSMTWAAATGRRKGATSAVRCIDVAALVAAAVMRRNPTAEVIPFEFGVCNVQLKPRDSIMTNASKLSAIGGGGTNCSAPLAMLNRRKAKGDLVIYVSDNESWVDAARGRGTATMREWQEFKRRNQDARMVCIDIQPYQTTQACERPDVMNIGGFSDSVFDVIGQFAAGRLNSDHWVAVIEAVEV